MKKIVSTLLLVAITLCMLAGCDSDYQEQTSDVEKQQSITKDFQQSQPTPTDIDYSLERYNLIRRAYWVNGQREKALSLPCPVEKPLGYVVLMLEGVGVVGNYVIDGKVSSLNSFLTPDSEYYEYFAGETSKKITGLPMLTVAMEKMIMVSFSSPQMANILNGQEHIFIPTFLIL